MSVPFLRCTWLRPAIILFMAPIIIHAAPFTDDDWKQLGGGLAGADGAVRAILRDDSGGVYAGGSFSIIGDVVANHIAYWNGSVWTNLGSGTDSYNIFALAMDSTGNLYAGGQFSTAGGMAAKNIAMWNGITWTNLAEGLDDNVNAIVIDSMDNVYVGGSFYTAGVVAARGVAKWDGASWSNIAPGLTEDHSIAALALDSATNLYVGGSIESIGSLTTMHVACWSDGAWTNLGEGLDSEVAVLEIGPSDNLYVGGYFNTAGTTPANYVAMWDGFSWTNLGDGVNGTVHALDLTESGKLLVGGDFDEAGGDPDALYIAQWDGTSWTNFYDSIDSTVFAIDGSDTNGIYAGGSFERTYNAETPMDAIAFWDGSQWNALGEEFIEAFYQGIRSVAVDPQSGYVYFGGSFSRVGDLDVNNIVRWDGSSWTNLGVGVNDVVHALIIDDNGDLVAGGEFSQAGGVSGNRYLARWDGSSWTNFGLANYFVYDLAPHPSTGFYATGRFTSLGGVSAQRIAYWNGSIWTNFESGLVGGAGTVGYAVTADKLGNMYVGGVFNAAGSSSSPNLARWTGTGWTNVWPGPGSPGTIRALRVDSSNNLYAAGSFSGFNNDVQRYDGSSWSALTPGVGSSPYKLAIDDDDNVYTVGIFDSAGVNQYANQIAFWNGTAWTNLGSGLGPVDSSGTFGIDLDGAGNPYVGGTFLIAGGKASAYVAYAQVNPAVNLIVTKSHSTDPVTAGVSVVYSLTVSNVGPSDATGVMLNDQLPAGFIATSPTNLSLGSLAVGVVTSVMVSADVASGALGNYTNVATVSANEGEVFPLNNTAYDVTTVTAGADLGVTKSDSVDPADAGNLLNYFITITNSGPSDALNVEVMDTMPTGLTPSGLITNTIGTLAAGASTTIVINAIVDSGLLGTITNYVTVTTTTSDNNSSNNDAEETTLIVGKADLFLTKVDSADPAVAGTSLGYTINVVNNGPSDAQNVEIVDVMPVGVSPGGTITNLIGTLAAGASTSIQYNVSIGSGVLGTITNVAEVTSSTTDHDPGNNDDDESTLVIAEADLGITKSDDADPVIAGTSLGYTITVTNSGPSDAYNVEIVDVMPDGVTPGGVTTNNVVALAAGSSTTILFNVTVNADTLGTITNGAMVTTSSTDNNAANDSVEETTEVDTEADVSLSKVGNPSLVIENNTVTYTLTVSNAGPSVATDVIVADNLPAGITPAAYFANFGSVAVGAVTSIQVDVTVNDTTVGVFTNNADVSTTATDNNAANDHAEAVTTIQDLDGDGIPDFADPDRDGDGIPDWWETLHYGGPTNANSSALAANGENTVFEMWVADIVPTNPASFYPPVGLTNSAPGTMKLTIYPTSTARVYDVLSNTNLLGIPQVWMPEGYIVTGSSAGLIFTVTNDISRQNYRTRVRLP